MFDTDPNPVAEIEGRIIQEVLYPSGCEVAPYEFNHIMSALMNVITFHMGLACPVCRKHIARKIKRDLPSMVVAAGELAAASSAKRGGGSYRCH